MERFFSRNEPPTLGVMRETWKSSPHDSEPKLCLFLICVFSFDLPLNLSWTSVSRELPVSIISTHCQSEILTQNQDLGQNGLFSLPNWSP